MSEESHDRNTTVRKRDALSDLQRLQRAGAKPSVRPAARGSSLGYKLTVAAVFIAANVVVFLIYKVATATPPQVPGAVKEVAAATPANKELQPEARLARADGEGESDEAPKTATGDEPEPETSEAAGEAATEEMDAEEVPSTLRSAPRVSTRVRTSDGESEPEDDRPADPGIFFGPRDDEDAETKPPVPEGVEAVMKAVREVYEPQKAATSEERKAMAERMFKDAEQTPDKKTRFAMVVVGCELAGRAGEIDLAFSHIQRLGEGYAIDRVKMKAEVFAAANKFEKKKETLFARALAWVDQALKGGEYAEAAQAAESARAVAASGNDAAGVRLAGERLREVQALQAEEAAVRAAMVAVKRDPKAPRANRILGRYYFFSQGKSDLAFKHLAQSDDAKLRDLAAMELKPPGKSQEQVALGDAWVKAAKGESGPELDAMRERALHWYGLSVSGLSGFEKAKAEKWLEEVRESLKPGPKNGTRPRPLIVPSSGNIEPVRVTPESNGEASLMSLDHWRTADGAGDVADLVTLNGEGAFRNKTAGGVVRTKGVYGDFVLKLEYRFLLEGRFEQGVGSGVLLKTAPPQKTLIELHLSPGKTGDLVIGGAAELAADPERRGAGVERRERFPELKEKFAGEWNTLEVISRGSDITVVLNGKPANQWLNTVSDSGPVALLWEGTDIEFRNITVREGGEGRAGK